MGNQTVAIQGRKFATFKTVGLATSTAVVSAGDYAYITIQNCSTAVTTVYACAAADQADAYKMAILGGCSAQDDGTGGSVKIENYTGPVSVSATSVRYIVAAA